MKNNDATSNYDAEPVYYCPKCYSLKVKYIENLGTDCCMNCGCTDIVEGSLEEWEKLYEKRYNHKYITKTSNPRGSIIFNIPIQKLQIKVLEHPNVRKLIIKLYPNFPQGLSISDMVILLFDKLSKDNRLDDLRYLLYNEQKENKNGREE